jgi:acylphosphatase
MFCRDEALNYRIRGSVRNRPDGSVEMEAEGPAGVLSDLVDRLKTSHAWARVDFVEEMDAAPHQDETEGFEIAF